MKKSIVLVSHFLFWIIILLSFTITPFILYYIPLEDYKLLSYMRFIWPLFFYGGYFGVMLIIRVRKIILYLVPTIILAYVILFFISKQAFAVVVAPLSSLFLWVTLGCLFRFFIDWFHKREERNQLEKQNMESKLALLKSQINPHFLFNTLHNIDALITENQENASKALIKLGEIMRYMLHDSQPNKVPLKLEVEYIENYLELEKLRIRNQLFLSVNIRGNFDNLKIAPMLFIPFIENAFKHCVETDSKNGIIIDLSINNNYVKFICENNYDIHSYEKDKSHGIGLETVKNRLKYIYPNSHKLEITTTNSVFRVKLEIHLNDN